MGEATPELFADGKCGKPMPAGELLQVFKFGQFCPVTVADGSDEVIVVVGSAQASVAAPTGKGSGASGTTPVLQSVTAADSPTRNVGGVTFQQLLAGEVSLKPEAVATTVVLRRQEVAQAIANGRVASRDGSWDLSMSPPVISELLEGRPVQMTTPSNNGPPTVLLLQPEASLIDRAANAPAITEFHVPEPELAGFLTDPWLPGRNGPLQMSLTNKNVEELASTKTTTVTVAGHDIPVTVTKEHLDPGNLPWGSGIAGGRPGDVMMGPGASASGSMVVTPGYQPRRPLRATDLKGITLAVYFEWNQEWVLKGFSRGRLLQSLALGPQEETTIELFTWDRRKRTLEQSSMTETEVSVEDEEKTQDASEVYRELTKKDEFQLKVGGSLDVGYTGPTVNVKLKADASSQDKTNTDDVTKNTTKALREGVHKAASKVKTQRTSKITETNEVGREERITRKVRNPNLCHTLNLDYFEVTSHYDITTSMDKDAVRFCAMIPNPIAQEIFAPAFVRRNEAALRDAILDRSLVSGFDALRLLRAREVALNELDQKRRRRAPQLVQIAPGADIKPPAPSLSPEESAANNYLTNLQQASKKILVETLLVGLNFALRSLNDKQPDLKTEKGSPRSTDLDQGKRWLAQQLFLRSYSQLAQVLGELAAAPEPLSVRDWGPRLAPIMPTPTAMPRPSQLNLEPQEVKEGVLERVVDPFVAWPALANWRWWWSEIRRVGLMEAEDAGLGTLVEQFDKVYQAFLDSQSRKAAEPTPAAVEQAQAKQDVLSDEDRLETDFPLRDYAIATERAEVLQKHLEQHNHHYSFALFRALPPQEQLEHIERAMASIHTGFDPGFFQPRVAGQIGPSLIVPLNHEAIPQAAQLLDILKSRITVKPETDTVLLPSPGITMDARLGQCSTCEDFIEDTRALDLDLRRAQLRQAQAEADRLEKRVSAAQLDDPKPQVPRLQLELEQHPGGKQ
jgi:hypothetical protein